MRSRYSIPRSRLLVGWIASASRDRDPLDVHFFRDRLSQIHERIQKRPDDFSRSLHGLRFGLSPREASRKRGHRDVIDPLFRIVVDDHGIRHDRSPQPRLGAARPPVECLLEQDADGTKAASEGVHGDSFRLVLAGPSLSQAGYAVKVTLPILGEGTWPYRPAGPALLTQIRWRLPIRSSGTASTITSLMSAGSSPS